MGEADVLARVDGIRGHDARSNAAIERLLWTDVSLRRRQAGYRSLSRRPRTREHRLRLVGVFAGIRDGHRNAILRTVARAAFACSVSGVLSRGARNHRVGRSLSR